MATNAAMVLAKEAGKKPRELAELIAENLRADDLIAKVDVAGPGFINLTLKAWAGDTLRSAIDAGLDYGRGAARKDAVNVEYVSANPTRPDACRSRARRGVRRCAREPARLRRAQGDARVLHQRCGAQVDVLARSAYLRYREALGEEIGAIPDGLYPGDYLKPVGAALAAEHGAALNQKNPKMTGSPSCARRRSR